MSETLPSWCDGAVRRAAHTLRTIVSIALVAFVSISLVFAADDMKAFPPAEEGMTRHVISLPKQEDETAFKVELIIGKTVKTDARNSYFFGGALETENIPGWGFERYITWTPLPDSTDSRSVARRSDDLRRERSGHQVYAHRAATPAEGRAQRSYSAARPYHSRTCA